MVFDLSVFMGLVFLWDPPSVSVHVCVHALHAHIYIFLMLFL